MSDYNVKLEIDGNKGRAFVASDTGTTLAEMTFSISGNAMWIIDHTMVGDSLRGKGIGRKMLDVIVAEARIKGIKILPLCPYAKSVFDKDKSLEDVLR
ncbi:MAG: GNAT family N-acetyltransferase [Saprospiraceae bacterium]|nr:GNAT family N-acetyltransferase [Saprospiraceae bacterium]